MAIYVTGDMHGTFKRFTKKFLSRLKYILVKGDYIIICGDFGLLWAHDKEFEYNIKWLSNLPFTILWVQGNHENYNMIKEYKLEGWNGGYVRHIVKDKIILLERGQIFTINGKTFFTFGGAESNDIEGGILDRNDVDFKLKRAYANKNKLNFRILNESWWAEELPSEDELNTGRDNLAKYSYNVDYIITHCAPKSLQNRFNISQHKKKDNILTRYLDEIANGVIFKHWYFGHYHEDINIDDKYTLVYNEIIKIGD